MKRFLILSVALVLLVSAAACGIESRQDKVLSSLGHYEFRHVYTSGGFQDYTDFAKYTFSGVDLEDNPYFASVSEEDRDTLLLFIDDFEGWIETIRRRDPDNEVVVNYAFDRSIIDTEDCFYIYEDEDYPEFGCYDVWFLDVQTNVLYYFHSNI